MLQPGSDPGFPEGRGANPPGGGRQHRNLPNLSKNCMKIARKFWSIEWGYTGARPWIHHCKQWSILGEGSRNENEI